MKSLSRRLLTGTTLAVAVVLATAGLALRALVEHSLVTQLDREVAARAELLASSVEQAGDELDLEFTELDMSEFASPADGGFLQVAYAGGPPVYRSPSLGRLGLESAAAGTEPRLAWVDLPGGARGRAAALRFRPRQDDAFLSSEPVDLTLVLVRDAGALDAALATLDGLLLLVGASTLAVMAVALIWVVRRSLRPVDAISQRIATIDQDGLGSRLETAGVPTELQVVVERVNELFGRLDAAFRRERAFSDDVAHELRVPLAGLRTTLEVAGARERGASDYAKALREGAAIVDDLQAMVDRLLQLARLDARRTRVRAEPFDLSELTVDAWEAHARIAADRDLAVDLRVPGGVRVCADRGLVELVLRNLFDNAVTYAEHGGRLGVAIARAGGELSIEVANSGSRLTPDEAAQAPLRFWRKDLARTEAGLHCGLGLALVQQAAAALGGALEVRSTPGGEFLARVTFPIAPDNGAARLVR